MKAVILCRISTREQQEGHSIKAQRKRLEEYCQKKDLDVIRAFEIIESSTRGERKEFNQMIDFIKAQKERVVLVADAVDRVQRGFKESVLLDDLRRKEEIEIHFLRENIVLNENSKPYEIMMWDYATMGAKSYVLQLSENVKRSVDYKLKKGEWITKAPVGYQWVTDPLTNEKSMTLDPERAYLVKRGFELYATGSYSFNEVARTLQKEGLTNNSKSNKPLSHSQIHKMLQNPFYHGIMRVKGVEYPHQYDRIVDEWLFDKCEQVRQGWHKKPFKYAGKPYVFRGLVKCADCGCSISSDRKKNKYTYLSCTKYHGNCSGMRVREEELIEQIKQAFKQLIVPEDVLADIQERLQKSHESKMAYHNQAINRVQKDYKLIQKQLDVLLDMRIKQSITQSEYDKKAKELKQQQYETEVKLKQYTKADQEFAITVSYLLNLSTRAYELFEFSKVDQKRQLINFALSNLQLRGRKLEYSFKKPFDAIASANLHSNWLRD